MVKITSDWGDMFCLARGFKRWLPIFFLALFPVAAKAASEINIYSYRQPFLTKPLFDAYSAKTGIKINVVFAKKGLIERIAQEGTNSPADVLLTVDIGRLAHAVKRGITQKVESAILNGNIPSTYRDPDGHWFGLTLRARVVYASRQRVQQTSITYEELADPKWRGKICVRSGQHVYNLGLIAGYMAVHGPAKTEAWLKGLKANLARRPSGNDRGQVKAVFAGECDIALANTYYMGAMATNKKRPEQKKWARSVRILFPNAQGRGVHVNISGMILLKHAPNRANAIALMTFLSSDKAQKIYAQVNFEYPVKPGVESSDLVKSWGAFKADTTPLAKIAKLWNRASILVDKVGFDD